MPCAKAWKLAFRNLLKIVWPSASLLHLASGCNLECACRECLAKNEVSPALYKEHQKLAATHCNSDFPYARNETTFAPKMKYSQLAARWPRSRPLHILLPGVQRWRPSMGSCCGQNAQETSIHWKHVMSPLHFISGDRWQHNIHCPFSPSAQICSQANRTRDHGPPNVYKHLPNKSPFPKLKEQHSWICSTRSSPGTLLFRKAKKPCVESHGREPTLKSNRDEKMRLKWWNLHPKQTISEIPKLDFETSIHAYANANSTETDQQAKTITPADTSRQLLAHKSQSLFPACCRTASVVKTRRSELKLKKQTLLPCESVSYPWNTRQRWWVCRWRCQQWSLTKCQVAATLCWMNGFTVRLVKTCCSQFVDTCGYSPFPFSAAAM